MPWIYLRIQYELDKFHDTLFNMKYTRQIWSPLISSSPVYSFGHVAKDRVV